MVVGTQNLEGCSAPPCGDTKRCLRRGPLLEDAQVNRHLGFASVSQDFSGSSHHKGLGGCLAWRSLRTRRRSHRIIDFQGELDLAVQLL